GDDAAGLAISENLKAQIRGLGQAKRNANDGISLIQTAEGGLNEVSNMLIRLRELSVQAASDTIGNKERGFLNVEFQQLKQEIQRISQVTEFNGTDLLNGTGSMLEIQIGTNNDPFEDRLCYDTSSASSTLEALSLGMTSVETKVTSQNSIDLIDTAIISVNEIRANLGALQNRLNSTVNNISIAEENMSAANSRIRDVDVAQETANLARNNILMQAGISVLAQANQTATMALNLLK
ncbi:MAG: flagellin FliC, partial [Oligoflexia bacterium]|nr:flagellin FliC [Oligoflexia bacterium]